MLDKTFLSTEVVELIITVITAFIASSGFWTYITRKMEKESEKSSKRAEEDSLERRLLMGLAHDRIVYLCGKYIDRGWITPDEHENLCKYLYEPYIEMGGNGSAERFMKEVDKLQFKTLPLSLLAKETKDAQQ